MILLKHSECGHLDEIASRHAYPPLVARGTVHHYRAGPRQNGLPATQARAGDSFESLPLLAAHTRGLASLPWHHRDPFDRMLIAQAKATGLAFLTADEAAAAYGDSVLLVR